MCGVLLFAAGVLVGSGLSSPRYPGLAGPNAELPHYQYVFEWGVAAGSNDLKLGTNGQWFSSKSSGYKLAAIAFHYRGDLDVLDTSDLQKSALYDIVPGTVMMRIKTDDAFRQRFKSGARVTNYVLLLVPHGVSMEQFSTLREAIAVGVIAVSRTSGPP